MAFADGTLYNVLEASAPHQITLKSNSGAVKKGEMVGYNSGWVLADDALGYSAVFIALEDGTSSGTINVCSAAIVSGVTGATPGAVVYLDDSGHYDPTVGGTTVQVVGRFLTATTMAINLFPVAPSTVALSAIVPPASTYFPVSNGTDLVGVPMSGDATMSNAGAVTIGSGKITVAKMTATAKKHYIRGESFDIDGAGATDTYQVLLVPVSGIEISQALLVYEGATSGTVATGSVRLGTAIDGQQIAGSLSFENSKAVGYSKAFTEAEYTVPAGSAIHVRFSGVATTQAGVVHVELEYSLIDP
jgi:uncharacterized protein YaiE (UPF0345 family)